jgi:lipopolysaccharide transport system ATP-binding protein
MTNIVITADNLGKKYTIGHQAENGRYVALRDVLMQNARSLWHKTKDLLHGKPIVQGDTLEEVWALRNIDFEIHQGEVVGIIGRNGSGKSTLLKVLSRITEPTEGRVGIRGRVSSLIEVGTGFHPELTGRENIFLNGTILGMTRAEIKRKFDEIVAFAEIEKFLDTPVKRYSSGMYVRLAFAVAAHLEPEILLVDEVLAVGDATFQKKCLGKMGEVTKEGRTVLFVSHNMGVIRSLCPRTIWLDNGEMRWNGQTSVAVREYLTFNPSQASMIDLSRLPRAGNSDARLRLNHLKWLSGVPLQHGESMRASIQFSTVAPIDQVTVGIGFSTLEGLRLLTYETDYQTGFRPNLTIPGVYEVRVEINSLPLAPGMYALDIGCRSGDLYALDYVPNSAQVEIIPGPSTPGYIVRQDAGVRLLSEWSWRQPGPKCPGVFA